MEKEFVPYDRALKLKALGFDEPCFGYYSFGDELIIETSPHQMISEGCCSAPTYSQAFRWFREKYQLQSEILWITDMNCFWYKTGKFKYSSRDLSKDDYKTYEEAELACLDKLIEIVENEKTL